MPQGHERIKWQARVPAPPPAPGRQLSRPAVPPVHVAAHPGAGPSREDPATAHGQAETPAPAPPCQTTPPWVRGEGASPHEAPGVQVQVHKFPAANWGDDSPVVGSLTGRGVPDRPWAPPGLRRWILPSPCPPPQSKRSHSAGVRGAAFPSMASISLRVSPGGPGWDGSSKNVGN